MPQTLAGHVPIRSPIPGGPKTLQAYQRKPSTHFATTKTFQFVQVRIQIAVFEFVKSFRTNRFHKIGNADKDWYMRHTNSTIATRYAFKIQNLRCRMFQILDDQTETKLAVQVTSCWIYFAQLLRIVVANVKVISIVFSCVRWISMYWHDHFR